MLSMRGLQRFSWGGGRWFIVLSFVFLCISRPYTIASYTDEKCPYVCTLMAQPLGRRGRRVDEDFEAVLDIG
jgi:hypothetical protein